MPVRRLLRRFAAGAVALALCAPAGAAPAPEAMHTLELRLHPDSHRLEAEARIETAGGGRIDFELMAELSVSRVAVDGKPVEAERDGARLSVPLGAQGTHTIEIAYAGELPPGRLGGRAGAVVQAAGSFLPPDSGWHPRGPAGRIAYRVTVTLPEGRRALVTGRRVETHTAEGRRSVTYAADHPSAGPVVFAGAYAETERTVEGVTLRTLFPPDLANGAELAEAYLDQAERYIAHFEATIGDYPYPAFSVVAAPFPVGLGFEGATYVSARILELPYMQGRSLAHEILHSWWGNAVAIAYDQGNWAEGLTTYQADHWVTAEDSLHAAAELRRQWLRDFAALPDSRRKPLNAFTFKAHDAAQVTGYNKAAMLFHMLRNRLGPEIFEAALGAFYDTHRFDRAGWADLQTAFESASGEQLSGLFDQWLTRPGAPRVRLDNASRAQTAEGWEIALTLAQDAPAYDLRVPVEIATPQGTSRVSVPLSERTTNSIIELDARPTALAVDPHADLFRQPPPSQAPLTLRHLTLDPATRVVALGVDADAARQIGEALLDTEAKTVAPDRAADGEMPLLAVGGAEAIDAFLQRAGFPAVPEQVAGQGSLRAWTAEAGQRPALFVAADDPGTLASAGRRLGYYLRSSWLVLDQGRVAARGTWPTGADPLKVTFGE